jgi:hypothetical protein
VTIQEVRWIEGGSQPEGYSFLYGNGITNYHFGTGIFLHKGIVSAVTGVIFSDRISHVTVTGCWCDIPASTEDESDDVKHSFYEELYCVFCHFPE